MDRDCAAQATRRVGGENYGNSATGSHRELRPTSGSLLEVSARGDSRDLECAGSGIGEREGQGLACRVQILCAKRQDGGRQGDNW